MAIFKIRTNIGDGLYKGELLKDLDRAKIIINRLTEDLQLIKKQIQQLQQLIDTLQLEIDNILIEIETLVQEKAPPEKIEILLKEQVAIAAKRDIAQQEQDYLRLSQASKQKQLDELNNIVNKKDIRTLWCADHISDLSKNDRVVTIEINREEEDILIAPRGYVVQQSDIDRYDQYIKDKQQEISKKQSDIEAKQADITKKDAQIQQKTSEIKTKQNQIQTQYILLSSEEDPLAINLIRDQINTLKLEQQELETQLAQLNIDKIALAQELLSLKLQLDDLLDDLSVLRAQLARLRKSFKSNTGVITPVIDDLTPQLQPTQSSGGYAVFYNRAALPAFQKWLPTYRFGTIRSIDYQNDKCSVDLDDAFSIDQNLDINQSKILENIPIRYMDCHASAFVLNDRVVIGFDQFEWQQGYVLGFQSNPFECCESAFIFYNQSQINKKIASSKAGFNSTVKESGHENAGSIDWTNGGEVITWGNYRNGIHSRYTVSDSDYFLYKCGDILYEMDDANKADFSIIGACKKGDTSCVFEHKSGNPNLADDQLYYSFITDKIVIKRTRVLLSEILFIDQIVTVNKSATQAAFLGHFSGSNFVIFLKIDFDNLTVSESGATSYKNNIAYTRIIARVSNRDALVYKFSGPIELYGSPNSSKNEVITSTLDNQNDQSVIAVDYIDDTVHYIKSIVEKGQENQTSNEQMSNPRTVDEFNHATSVYDYDYTSSGSKIEKSKLLFNGKTLINHDRVYSHSSTRSHHIDNLNHIDGTPAYNDLIFTYNTSVSDIKKTAQIITADIRKEYYVFLMVTETEIIIDSDTLINPNFAIEIETSHPPPETTFAAQKTNSITYEIHIYNKNSPVEILSIPGDGAFFSSTDDYQKAAVDLLRTGSNSGHGWFSSAYFNMAPQGTTTLNENYTESVTITPPQINDYKNYKFEAGLVTDRHDNICLQIIDKTTGIRSISDKAYDKNGEVIEISAIFQAGQAGSVLVT